MKYLVVLLFCIASISANSIGISQNSRSSRKIGGRIIGGQPANAGEFPFAAAIYYRTSVGTYFCGGGLISNQYILTGGHCVNGGLSFTIHLGTNNLYGNESTLVVASTSTYFTHPQFEVATYANDIGLIELRMPVQLTDYIQPMYLPTVDLSEGITVTAVGWGATNDETSSLSNELNFVEVVPLANTECQNIYGSVVTDTMVCVEGNFNEGACRGDLGSPIAITLNHHVWHVGVSTFISGNGCESQDPSGYTRTFPYVDWIKTTAGL